MNGINGTILLTGKGNKVIQPHIGDGVADVVPVDYVARLIIGSAVTLTVPQDYQLPQVAPAQSNGDEQPHQQPNDSVVDEQPTQPERPSDRARAHKRTSSTASRMSMRSMSKYSMPKSFLSGHQEHQVVPCALSHGESLMMLFVSIGQRLLISTCPHPTLTLTHHKETQDLMVVVLLLHLVLLAYPVLAL